MSEENIKYELIVVNWKGFEMDRKSFDSEEEASRYFKAEWGDSDAVADHIITPSD